MEGSDRRVGWIVIAIGALILGYMLGSARNSQPPVIYIGSNDAAVAPQAPQAPGQRVAPQAPGPQFGPWRGDRFGPGWRHQDGPQFGPGVHAHRPFFFAPFMFLGGLLKLGLLALLVFWVLRRWRGGPPWARRWHEDRPADAEKRSAPQSTESNNDDTTYTGGTTKL